MSKTEFITLGGGCFWCTEAIFQRLKGVVRVLPGYSGGQTENPTMQQVYAGDTGHAEVVDIEFEPSVITLKELCEIFFTLHDPTTLNRQGNDVGDEYRSIIFYRNDEQKVLAEDIIKGFAASLWDDPIVTELSPFTKFWPTTEDQVDYFNNHPNAGYCQIIINPKIQKLRQKFTDKLVNN
jgi:peptide-methionine (S)-S-oxide reductase